MKTPYFVVTIATSFTSLCSCSTEDTPPVDASNDAGDDANDGRVEAPIPPEAMWGVYDGTLSGTWEGMCLLTIARNAELRDLHAEREGWVAHHRGIYYTDDVTETDGSWTFTFEIVVDTADGEDHQQWAFEIPENNVTDDGFTGGYTHTSEVIGSSTGTLVGVRRPGP